MICQTCGEHGDKLKELNDNLICKKCFAISELTFSGNIHEEYAMVMPAAGYFQESLIETYHFILFFTSNRIIFAIYEKISGGTTTSGIAANRGYTGWLVSAKMKKVTKELALEAPETVLLSFPLNFAIHYEDIKKFKFDKKGHSIELIIETDKIGYNFPISEKHSYGLESLLHKYLGNIVDWSLISIIPPGSKLIKKLPEPKEIIVPPWIEDHLRDKYLKLIKIQETNNLAETIPLASEIIESGNCSDLTLQFFYSIRGSAYFANKRLDEAKSDYQQSLKCAEKIDQDNLIAKGNKELAERALKDLEKTKSSCFIATAACGNRNSWEVKVLRNYRDNYLDNTRLGSELVLFYYQYSPRLAVVPKNWTMC